MHIVNLLSPWQGIVAEFTFNSCQSNEVLGTLHIRFTRKILYFRYHGHQTCDRPTSLQVIVGKNKSVVFKVTYVALDTVLDDTPNQTVVSVVFPNTKST